MADDKKKRGPADRARVAANERYEVAHLAAKFGVTSAVARKVADAKGPMRSAVEKALGKEAAKSRSKRT